MMPHKTFLHGVDILRISCLAVCDRRTVRRYADGLPVTHATAVRIERALRELGVELDRRVQPAS